jgi:hypothetical protein
MAELRLGDVIDDFCVKCRRITNHSVVSIVNEAPAKVRCRTCYNDHDYLHETAPPSKKDLKKQELFKQVLGSIVPPEVPTEEAVEEPAEEPETPATKKEPKAARSKKA